MGGQDQDQGQEREQSGAFKLPSKAALKAAADRKTNRDARGDESRPGRVVGLDYAMWASAVVDLSSPEKNRTKIASHRRRLADKGYTMLEGEPVIDSFPLAEAWIKPRSEWLADREQRNAKIAEAQRRGYMSDTAMLKQKIDGPYGTHYA